MALFSQRANDDAGAAMRFHSVITWENGHVRAAVLKLGDGTAELMGVAAAPVHGSGGSSLPDVERWCAGGARALTQAEGMTAQTGSRKAVPNHVTMCVPSEVTQDLTVTVSQRRRSADRSISFDELRALLRKGYRTAQDSLETRSREGGARTSYEIVWGAIARMHIDGQPVVDPEGMYGQAIDIDLAFALVQIEWIRALEAVADRLELRLEAIVPHHVAYAAPITEPLALLVVLDAEQSLAGLVRRGRLAWVARAPIGVQQMVKGATRGLNLSDRQVNTLMRAFRAGQLREDFQLDLARSLWVELRRWMATLAERARQTSPVGTYPHRVYICDVTRSMPEGRLSLETPFWEQQLPFGRAPEVVEMDVSLVHNVLDWTSHASGGAFLLLRSLAHHVGRLYAPGSELDRVLAETIRWRSAAPRALRSH
jgi:hypothetical protein